MDDPVIGPLGDSALLVTLSREMSGEANDLVLNLARSIEEAKIPGVEEVQPAYSSICVHFDPEAVGIAYIEALVRKFLGENGSPGQGSAASPASGFQPRLVEIPVKYGGQEGPDLDWAAQHLGMSAEELVRRHTAPVYRVYMVGFSPGFPYLGGMDPALALPRLPEPRSKVPAGSVGIGGNQTGVYPMETPGGWRILGRTELELFSPYRDDPSLFHPGDRVKFVPVGGPSPERTDPGEGRSPDRSAQAPSGRPGTSPLAVPVLSVEYPGFFTIVVDRGRFGYRKVGVPVSGPADAEAYLAANACCGNDGGEAALEMTLLGGKFRALMDCTVAVSGAPARIAVDGKEAPMDEPLFLPSGSVLEVGPMGTGCRSYLAVSGGIEVPSILGSKSTYVRGGFGGYLGRALKAGDVLQCGPAPGHESVLRRWAAAPRDKRRPARAWAEPVTLRIIPGPEADPRLLAALCSDSYTVRPESDRMGLRLAGPEVPVGRGDILSSPVVPGTIQVPSDGKPLLLLCDAQTTGGYKRVAVVATGDLPMAGQLRPGSRVALRLA